MKCMFSHSRRYINYHQLLQCPAKCIQEQLEKQEQQQIAEQLLQQLAKEIQQLLAKQQQKQRVKYLQHKLTQRKRKQLAKQRRLQREKHKQEQLAKQHQKESAKQQQEERAQQQQKESAKQQGEERAKQQGEKRAKQQGEERAKQQGEERAKQQQEQLAEQQQEQLVKQQQEQLAEQQQEQFAKKQREERAKQQQEQRAKQQQEESAKQQLQHLSSVNECQENQNVIDLDLDLDSQQIQDDETIEQRLLQVLRELDHEEDQEGIRSTMIDLHDLSLTDAMRIFTLNLSVAETVYKDNGYSKQMRYISVITGQGIRSKNGPVIKPEVEDYLKEHGYTFSWKNKGMVVIDLQKQEQEHDQELPKLTSFVSMAEREYENIKFAREERCAIGPRIKSRVLKYFTHAQKFIWTKKGMEMIDLISKRRKCE